MSQEINRVSIFISRGSQFILIFRHRNGQDYYAVPGGGIEINETPQDAAIREITEELGIKLSNITLFNKTITSDRHDYLFTAQTSDGEFIITGPEKKHLNDTDNLFRPVWLDKDTLKKDVPIYPESLRNYVKSLIDNL